MNDQPLNIFVIQRALLTKHLIIMKTKQEYPSRSISQNIASPKLDPSAFDFYRPWSKGTGGPYYLFTVMKDHNSENRRIMLLN